MRKNSQNFDRYHGLRDRLVHFGPVLVDCRNKITYPGCVFVNTIVEMNLTDLESEAYLATFALWGSEVYLVICLAYLVTTQMCVSFLNTTLDSCRFLLYTSMRWDYSKTSLEFTL